MNTVAAARAVVLSLSAILKNARRRSAAGAIVRRENRSEASVGSEMCGQSGWCYALTPRSAGRQRARGAPGSGQPGAAAAHQTGMPAGSWAGGRFISSLCF